MAAPETYLRPEVIRQVGRFRKLGQALSKRFTPNLEKALTLWDDKLLGAPSNAVERGHRGHRQVPVYRVRTQPPIGQWIARASAKARDLLFNHQANGRRKRLVGRAYQPAYAGHSPKRSPDPALGCVRHGRKAVAKPRTSCTSKGRRRTGLCNVANVATVSEIP